MASKKNKARSARDLNPRKFKKKTSVLVIDKVEYIDYKDVDLLGRFMSDRAKIKNRRVAGNTLQQQREIANAVKVAREMALLPYAKRVASTRTGGRGRDGGREGGRDGGREGGREGGRDRETSLSDSTSESTNDTTNDTSVEAELIEAVETSIDVAAETEEV
jgi:small subunit ribosomal protein S18